MLVVTGAIVLIGKLPVHKIVTLLLADYGIRVIFSIIAAAPATIYVSYMKRKMHINIYDVSTQFNPFKLSVGE